MSHNSSRSKALNSELPLNQRASHVRSCANHVSARLGITREELFKITMKATGVDLNKPESESDLMKAFIYFEQL
ncbi:hypothetical protein U2T78_001791 [Providencia stuartii]|uniref:Uncharacterized protein n=3 Tax=Gammaproteobacteria TaxID=1236 RepID=A0AAJ1JJP3_PROST|nr:MULTISPECIES: hypothetical protein [Providencia]AFH95567.1 hypothetical protein S70_18840 [Providencia stuartii MRSN 2154]SST02880.1 Uncharacterised protein [Acinetobacter baumannii]AMG66318.1 hypothetical protein AL507_06815 [Providencia stuartii]EMA3641101.1 hypothetical protein [Providencia stuartii]KNZ83571.1 hypothetical protein AFL46_14935 [Providencia stuartii]